MCQTCSMEGMNNVKPVQYGRNEQCVRLAELRPALVSVRSGGSGGGGQWGDCAWGTCPTSHRLCLGHLPHITPTVPGAPAPHHTDCAGAPAPHHTDCAGVPAPHHTDCAWNPDAPDRTSSLALALAGSSTTLSPQARNVTQSWLSTMSRHSPG